MGYFHVDTRLLIHSWTQTKKYPLHHRVGSKANRRVYGGRRVLDKHINKVRIRGTGAIMSTFRPEENWRNANSTYLVISELRIPDA